MRFVSPVQSDGEDDPECSVDSHQLVTGEEAERGSKAFGINGCGLFDQDEGRFAADVYLGAKDGRPR